MLEKVQTTKLHFIGVGGIGMSGIAEVLLDLGYKVSGSDLNSSSVTEHLKNKGCEVFIGHNASNVEGATLVIYSSAVNDKNPEWIRSLELKIPLIKRAEMLAELMRLKKGIAIAGSHGKTTTTSLVATIFQEAELDATHIIGGIVHNLGGNAKKGNGEYLIAEADESDGSFLLLSPELVAVTNIDNDHLDHYGSKEKIIDAFVEFSNKLPFFGKIALNANDLTSVSIKPQLKRPAVWYGIDVDPSEVEYVAKNVKMNASGTSFDLYIFGNKILEMRTPLWGIHNVSNALAAIALSNQVGIKIDTIQKGLSKFQGVGRRLEKVYEKNNFLVIDDYGHHPTEIMATISSVCAVDKRPVCVVFEPHRYTRTLNFWIEFQNSFSGASEVYISPIYPASEKPIPGITADLLVDEMKKKGVNVFYLSSLNEMQILVSKKKDENCILLTMGAGAISKKIRECVNQI